MTTNNPNTAAATIADAGKESKAKANHALRLQSIVELAGLIKADVIQDGNTFLVHKEVFTKHMPDGVTPESYKAATNYATDFTSASVRAVGELAFEHLAMSPDTKDASMKATLIGGHIEANFERSRTFPGINGGKDTVRQGYVTVKKIDTGMKGANSMMTSIHQHLSKLAEDLFLKDNT